MHRDMLLSHTLRCLRETVEKDRVFERIAQVKNRFDLHSYFFFTNKIGNNKMSSVFIVAVYSSFITVDNNDKTSPNVESISLR